MPEREQPSAKTQPVGRTERPQGLGVPRKGKSSRAEPGRQASRRAAGAL